MTTSKTSSKPTITPENHDANVGQRDRDSDEVIGTKPTIEIGRHANSGERAGASISEPADPKALADRGSAKLHGDDLEAAIPRDIGAYRRDPLTDEPEEQANVGQRLTGNKNAGADLEGMSPVSSRYIDRPTRDDGDNDDMGDLGSRASGYERGYPRG
jgi:hypothetical protein